MEEFMEVYKHPTTTHSIQVNLTTKEAGVIRSLLKNVGGSPAGPRGVASHLSELLQEIGVEPAKSVRTSGYVFTESTGCECGRDELCPFYNPAGHTYPTVRVCQLDSAHLANALDFHLRMSDRRRSSMRDTQEKLRRNLETVDILRAEKARRDAGVRGY